MGKIEKISIYIILVLIIVIAWRLITIIQREPENYDKEVYAEIYDEFNNITSENEFEDIDRNPDDVTDVKEIDDGLVIGTIEIPKINIFYPVVCETTNEYLKMAPTKLAGVNLNDNGNCSIIGHNYEDERFFSRLNELENGDVVNVRAKDGDSIQYTVSDIYEINYKDVRCTKQNEMDKKELTLLTCTNKDNKRLVVKCFEK